MTSLPTDCRLLLRSLTVALLLALLFSLPACVGAAGFEITLREQLNQDYRQELVGYAFSASQGACHPASLTLQGPVGPLAAQLTDRVLWPDGTVRSARLVFVVDSLPPLSALTYRVAYGPTAVPSPATDLTIKAAADSVELTTSRLGLRLPLGEKRYDPPLGWAQAPNPLTAVRLGTGPWGGGSALTGDASLASCSSQLVESGPVLASVRTLYTFTDGKSLALTATLVAGDSTVRWQTTATGDQPSLAAELRLPPLPGIQQAVLPKGYGGWAKDRTQAVAPSADPLFFLSPDSSVVNIFPECPPHVVLAGVGGQEVQLHSQDPGLWADPGAPCTYAGFKSWHLDMIPQMWENWKRKRLPVLYAPDGTLTLRANLVAGSRKWTASSGAPVVGERLDRIKDMILDWPEAPTTRHPRLFVSGDEVRDVSARAAGDPALQARLSGHNLYAGNAFRALAKPADQRTPDDLERSVGYLRQQLALLGNWDLMRGAIGTAGLYDALLGSDLVSPADRSLFRAQTAYLAYLMADPTCWDIERGYASGNPNMSVSYTLSLGVLACALPDHPLAKVWAQRATDWMDAWLTHEVGPHGEWLPEGSHYGHVSLGPLLSYAIAAQRAGFHDFTADPRLKQLMLYFAKYYTPRDPQRRDQRVTGAFGRGTSGDSLGMCGVAARMWAGQDDELSRQMQWMWQEFGYPTELGDHRLGGCEAWYTDARLPAQPPAWGSELFPALGALLRHGFNTPAESYVNVLACVDSLRNLDLWTPGVGGIAQWFGRGKPLSTCFAFATGYNERHELLRDGVRLGHNWGQPADAKGPFGYYTQTRFGAFAALPGADYVRSSFVITKPDDRDWFPDKLPAFPREVLPREPRLDWTRQVLFVKDPDPAGPAYLVLRDTTVGGQPTAWQFWSLSEKLGSAAEAALPEAFLADKPGPAILPARELPPGDRYTALGQQGMDLEYFVAAPTNTPRSTLRFGGVWAGVPEYQDLLHLQLPGDGAYYLVLYPRPRAEAAPAFAALDGRKLLKLTVPGGTDYAFLADAETSASADQVSVRGTAAAVQFRAASTCLSLAAPGEVRAGDWGLRATHSASLTVAARTLSLDLPPGSPAGELFLRAPAGYKLSGPDAGAKLSREGNQYRLTLPAGITRLVLTK